MPAKELLIGGRKAYFRKSISHPDFGTDRVLSRDAFQFVDLWLRRNCKAALPYWNQAQTYYDASKDLPVLASPLTSYYCFLNATKALLMVKGIDFSERHGVGGDFDSPKRALSNEKVRISQGEILGLLSRYLGETDKAELNLSDILSNLPFIHRAYRYTYRSHPELFIPVKDIVYRSEDGYCWLTAEVDGRYSDGRKLKTIPGHLEVDHGFGEKCVLRTKKKIKWYKFGANEEEKLDAIRKLHVYHSVQRRHFCYISSTPSIWYLKRKVAKTQRLGRYSLTLIFAAMHRLSELSRYDPQGLVRYLDGHENWLLTEFIELAPAQFMDELVCELTSLEFAIPGARPRTL